MSDPPPLTPLNRVLCPRLNLFPPNTPPNLYADTVAYFTSIPWCAELLLRPDVDSPDDDSPGPAAPAAIPFIPQCVNPASPQHDQFVGATLASHPRGLEHMLCFFRPRDAAHARDALRPVDRVDALFALGDGLTGYRGLLHGGMAATLVDEAMGTVNEINTALGKRGLVHERSSVTARLEMEFRRPVRLPAVVRVTSWTEGIDGRKTRVRCELRDGQGVVLATAASVWVALRPSL
ncbi:uncharacterized protein UV8b_03601 [Ustilaginoidea virens]|uniref:Thioesterase domain-containing protein n=1 Tax=Ustilaginoidea virens TaxID=1159556 RepID=A0A8E5HPL9_USTVR|nr:uncharacterized protein UV8b_03601 [Ustilaginoidea virens]QUC19360.1 hypothetical protein UV8b_03601 [Ustilaginoidea virens]